MADYYLKLSTNNPERINSTAYTLGQKVVPARTDTQTNHAVMKRYVYEATTAGTSGAAAPSYPTTPGATVADGTVIWTCRECTSWANAARYLDYIGSRLSAGDTLYVASDHTESLAASIVHAFTGTPSSTVRIISVDETNAALATTTSTITTTSNQTTTLTGSFYMYGHKFNIGTGSTASTINFSNSGANRQFYEKCQFMIGSTAGASMFAMGSTASSAAPSEIVWKDCDIKINFSTQGIRINRAKFKWIGGSVLSGSVATSAPLFLHNAAGSSGFHNEIYVENVDLTNLGVNSSLIRNDSTYMAWIAKFVNCKLPTSWTGTLINSTVNTLYRVEMHNCDSGDTNYRLWIEDYAGTITSDPVVYKNSGSSDGTTSYSHKIVMRDATASYLGARLESTGLPAVWNEVLGTQQTATVDILASTAVALTNEDVWLELTILGTNGFPLGTVVSSSKAQPLAAATQLTSSSATWTGSGGVTNPVAYKLSVNFTAREKGFLQGKIVGAKSGLTFYVDQKIQVT